MLKNFKNLKGAQVLSKNEQKAINGGQYCPFGCVAICNSNGYIMYCLCDRHEEVEEIGTWM